MNSIVHACLDRGSYTLSAGTLEPAIVLRRLLDALRVIDADSHRAFVASSTYVAIPTDALHDELHRWWGSDAAIQLVENLILRIDLSMAPYRFVCGMVDLDHFVLEPLQDTRARHATSRLPPNISALRARVRPEER